MTKLVKILAWALGLGLFAAGLGTITSSPAPAAGAAPVNIAQVSVASVPVSGMVNIGTMPAVTFAAGSSVNVSNPLDASKNPIPLATLDAFQPYEDACSATSFPSGNTACQFQAVPAGKRLVIQEVDVFLLVPTGVRPIHISVSTGAGVHYFTATFMASGLAPIDFFATHQETRLYASQTIQPSCVVFLNALSDAAGDFRCQLSGFLVDVP
jgi:hypothetical protein